MTPLSTLMAQARVDRAIRSVGLAMYSIEDALAIDGGCNLFEFTNPTDLASATSALYGVLHMLDPSDDHDRSEANRGSVDEHRSQARSTAQSRQWWFGEIAHFRYCQRNALEWSSERGPR